MRLRAVVDASYVELRNHLIPQAVEHADHVVKGLKLGSHDLYARAWNLAYFARMDDLARACGLVRR